MLSTHSRLSKLWRLQRSRRQEIKLLFLTLPWLCNMTLGKQYRRSEAGSWDAGSYTVACLRVMLVTRKTSPPHKHPVSPNFTSSFGLMDKQACEDFLGLGNLKWDARTIRAAGIPAANTCVSPVVFASDPEIANSKHPSNNKRVRTNTTTQILV